MCGIWICENIINHYHLYSNSSTQKIMDNTMSKLRYCPLFFMAELLHCVKKIIKICNKCYGFFMALMYYSECQRETIRNQPKKG